ncbi:hypothetical protein ABIE16_001568 [Pseudomonas sp. 2725]
MRSLQSTLMVIDPPQSRASSLPQGLHVPKDIYREITSGDPPVFLYQANTKYLRTVSTTSQVPFIPGSMTKMSPARKWIGAMPSGVMTQ